MAEEARQRRGFWRSCSLIPLGALERELHHIFCPIQWQEGFPVGPPHQVVIGYGPPPGWKEVISTPFLHKAAHIPQDNPLEKGVGMSIQNLGWGEGGTSGIYRRPPCFGEMVAIFSHCCGFQSYALCWPGEGIDPKEGSGPFPVGGGNNWGDILPYSGL